MPEEKVHRGLMGVYFERSPTTFIDGRAGDLHYRGYSIHDLARNSTFEETSCLLLNGDLPTRAKLEAFEDRLNAARTLPESIYDLIRGLKDAHPMDVLRTAVSALGSLDPEAADSSPEAPPPRRDEANPPPRAPPPRRDEPNFPPDARPHSDGTNPICGSL